MIFDGNVIVGDVVGTEVNFAAGNLRTNNIAYSADVTSIVTGTGIYTIEDGDPGDLTWLNGAGLIVIYDDGTDQVSQISIADGLDFAYKPASPVAATVTDPVTITYAPVGVARIAELFIFAGDAEANRGDLITVSDNADIVNQMDADEGTACQWLF